MKALLCLLNKILVIRIQNHLNYLKRINNQLSFLNRKVDWRQEHSNYRQYITGTASYSGRICLSFIIIYDVFNDKSSIRLSFSCNDTWDNRKTVLEEVLRIMLGCCRIMLPAHLHKINWTLLLCSTNNTKLWVPQTTLSYEYDVTMNIRNERRKADMLKNFSIISCSDYSNK